MMMIVVRRKRMMIVVRMMMMIVVGMMMMIVVGRRMMMRMSIPASMEKWIRKADTKQIYYPAADPCV